MQALLQAYARAWAQAGAGDLARLVGAVEPPYPSVSAHNCVPAGILADYNQAIAGAGGFADLHRELVQSGKFLTWMQGNMTMPENFRNRFAYVELAGPDGMITTADIRFGLYLQQSQVVYPSHWHAAVEDYLIVSGTALWQTDADDFEPRTPGNHFRHFCNQPHATTTLDEPLLALWFWQGDISIDTYRIVGVNT